MTMKNGEFSKSSSLSEPRSVSVSMSFAGSPSNGDLTNDPGSSFLSVVCVAFRFWESFPVRKFPPAMLSRLIFKTATINSADDSVMDCVAFAWKKFDFPLCKFVRN